MIHSVRQVLREATAVCHRRVDDAFAGFDLSDTDSYGAFLAAHARVLPSAEEAIGRTLWVGFAPRMPLLLTDLAELRLHPPASLPLRPMGLSARWGTLYVLEGSRLGGSMLAGRVKAGMPVHYLSAGHACGSWQAFQAALESAATELGVNRTAWLEGAVEAAAALFRLFEQAAALELANSSNCQD
jgi:heme oxygenase